MGFYQFFIIFICNTYLILFNVFTATADDPNYSLTLTAPDSAACPGPFSTQTNASLQCRVGNALSAFSMECAVNPPLEKEHVLAWYQEPSNKSEKQTTTLLGPNERVKISDNKLTITSLEATDARVYHCRVMRRGDENSGAQYIRSMSMQIVVPPRIRGGSIPKEVVGIEENPIHLNCTVVTNMPVKVHWRVANDVIKNEMFTKSSDRYLLSGEDTTNMLTDGMFTIKSANLKDDRGTYTCWGESESFGKTSTNMTFTVRIKSKYAALWPFLGICAEVVILCVIILIYEKKRDKTELEESDTDQGPETKSSPDHVQDNVRYRK